MGGRRGDLVIPITLDNRVTGGTECWTGVPLGGIDQPIVPVERQLLMTLPAVANADDAQGRSDRASGVRAQCEASVDRAAGRLTRCLLQARAKQARR